MDNQKVERVNLYEVLEQQAYILKYVKARNTRDNLTSNKCMVNSIQMDLPSIAEIKSAQNKKQDKNFH